MLEVSNKVEAQPRALNPWLNPGDAAKEIRIGRLAVDYSRVVTDHRVLFLAEDHFNHAIRQHLAQHAVDLRKAGITHYAIEANEAGNVVFEKLGGNKPVDLSRVSVGPGRADYEKAIRAIAAQGIKVCAIDIDRSTSPSREEREALLEKNIQRLLQEDPNNKVAVLIGSLHALRNTDIFEGVPSVGNRLMKAGVPTTNVHFTGGESRIPTDLTGAAEKAALANQEFMLDFRPYANLAGILFGKGETDWVIHLPQHGAPLGDTWWRHLH